MNDAPDPLETELFALKPQEVSFELRRRIAQHLADEPTGKTRRLWWFALAGGLAACLAIVLILWRSGRSIDTNQIETRPQLARVEDPGPTLQAYQQALASSPEELDALLDKHAANPEPSPDLGLDALSRTDSVLNSLLGDQ